MNTIDTRSNPALLPALAAATTVVLWASAFIAIRALGHVFSPGAMAFLRLVPAVLVLTLFLAIHLRGIRKRDPAARPLPEPGPWIWLVIVYGAAWFGGYMVLLNWAEQHIDAGTAALLINVAPILVAVLAGIFLAEGFNRAIAAGIVISFIGVIVITAGGGQAHVEVLGVVLALGAAVLYALGVLLQKVVLRSVDATTATWMGAMVGLLVTLPFAPTAVGELAGATVGQITAVIYLGVGPTAIAFTTWAYALARTDAGAMAATTLVVPAIVIALSWVLLGEMPTVLRVIGGALALLGVAISRGLVPLPTLSRPQRGPRGWRRGTRHLTPAPVTRGPLASLPARGSRGVGTPRPVPLPTATADDRGTGTSRRRGGGAGLAIRGQGAESDVGGPAGRGRAGDGLSDVRRSRSAETAPLGRTASGRRG